MEADHTAEYPHLMSEEKNASCSKSKKPFGIPYISKEEVPFCAKDFFCSSNSRKGAGKTRGTKPKEDKLWKSYY